MSRKFYKIFLVAGEPSGDFIGGKLLSALKGTDEQFQFMGVGGDQMVREGLEEVLPFSDFSIMGIFENIPKAYQLYKHVQHLKERILKEKPDLLITIDFPGFNFRLGKTLKDSGVPHLHYVGPTVWAWRPWRAKTVSRFLKHLCVLFPFEPPYFEKHGLPTSFVGHPLMEEALDTGNANRFRKAHKIPKSKEVLLFLPGSRRGELSQHMDVFQEVSHKLVEKGRNIQIVIPTLESMKPLIPEEGWGAPVTFVTDTAEKQDAYAASNLALAASGTIALELALAKVPMIITYKAKALSAWLVRRLIKIPYACMINILLKRQVIPELIQEECRADLLTKEILALMKNERLREKQFRAFDAVERKLSPEGKKPSEAAADVVMKLLRGE